MSSRFSSNSEELLENIEDMFPQYYMESDVINRLISSITHWGVTRRESVNIISASFPHK